MGLDRRHHQYSSGSHSPQITNSFTSFINVFNLVFLLGEVNTFFNPKDSSYLYLPPSLLVNFLTNYLELCNIVTFLFLTLTLTMPRADISIFYKDGRVPRADISALTKLVYFVTSQWRRHLWRNVVAVPSSSKGPLKGKHLLFLHWFVMKSFRCRAVFYTPHNCNWHQPRRRMFTD